MPRRRMATRTAAELLSELGDITPDRFLIDPPPGHATEADLIRIAARKESLYELVDGTIIHKVPGWEESALTGWIVYQLYSFIAKSDLGEFVGPTCHFRLKPGLVRSPCVSFCTWDTLDGVDEDADIADCIPDLAIEVLREANTPREMTRKLKEYFKAGTTLVWYVYPKSRTVVVYTSPGRSKTLGIGDTLDGGTLLPGFKLPLRTLFGRPTKELRRKRK